MDADASNRMVDAIVTIQRRYAADRAALAAVVSEFPEVLSPVAIVSAGKPYEPEALVIENIAFGVSRDDEKVEVAVLYRKL